MGLSIGPASIAISSLNSANASRNNRQVAPDAVPEEEARLVERPEAPPVEAGFGENTLSPQGAALTTLDTNLEVAADVVPTVEELRARARVVQAERNADAPTRRPVERPDELRLRETVRPEPNAAVRNFVQDVSSAEPTRITAPEISTQAPSPAEDVAPAEPPAASPSGGAPNSRIDFFA